MELNVAPLNERLPLLLEIQTASWTRTLVCKGGTKQSEYVTALSVWSDFSHL